MTVHNLRFVGFMAVMFLVTWAIIAILGLDPLAYPLEYHR